MISDTKGKQVKYQTHEAVSYWYMIVSNVPGYKATEKKIYVGDDAPTHLLDNLKEDAEKIFKDYIKKPKAMIFEAEDEKKFWVADTCHICSKVLIRVQHHCHNMRNMQAKC